jgi:hypothetical protein
VDRSLYAYDSGTETLQVTGGDCILITKHEYADYALTMEYKWGSKTGGNKARGGSINVHAGADGIPAHELFSVFGVFCGEGMCGNVVLRTGAGPIQAVARVRERPAGRGSQWVYDPQSSPVTLVPNKSPSGFNGRVYHPNAPEQFEDVRGVHPPGDPSRPGEWNTLEINCRGATLTFRVNGQDMVALTDLSRSSGKIVVALQGCEAAIRRLELAPAKPR